MALASVSCPNCQAALKLPANYPAGAKARCPKCSTPVALPNPPSTSNTQAVINASSQDATQAREPDAEKSVYLEAPKSPDELGWLGPYRILRQLGEGGMGLVYEAEDTKLRRRIALKVMLPKHAANPTASARFLREARAQAAVEHEHVASIFLVGDDQAVPYIAMPLLKGQTLQAALKANPRPPVNEILRLGQEMAEGLAAAHAIGLIHRDIKPANVWLEGHKRKVKILDFGLARAVAGAEVDVDESEGPKTQQGAMLGTPAYMSPEQGRGEELDARSDLFSLGVVLYEMATGERPFKGKDVWGILTSLAVDNPAPPHTKNPAIPESLSAVILKILAKRPAERPLSGEEIAESLRQIERGVQQMPVAVPIMAAPMVNDPWEDIDATSAGDTSRATVASPVTESDTDASPRSPKTKLLIGFGGLLTAIVLGVIVIKITNKDGSVTELKVPEGSKVEVTQGGKTTVVAEPGMTKKPVVVAPNTVDYALKFDGEGDAVSVSNLKFDGNSPVTLEGWFTPTTIAGTGHVLRIGKVGSDQLSIRLANNEWHCILSNDANPGFVQYAAAKAKAGRRDHVAGVWDGRELRIYINGKSYAPTRVEAKIAAGRPQGELAMTYGKSTGIVAEVRISKNARYDKDFVPQSHFETDKDTLALYHCDEAEGDVLKDSSGNNHHGKITGAKWVKVNSVVATDTGAGYMLQFDGETNYVEVPSLGCPPKGPITIEGFFTPANNNNGRLLILSSDTSLAAIEKKGSTWHGIVGRSGPFSYQGGGKGVVGQKSHVAVVWDGSTQTSVFVDGKKVSGSEEGKSSRSLAGQVLYLGADLLKSGKPGNGFAGLIGEVRISKSIRYDKDFTPSQRHQPDADTLALYHFDEGQGDVLKDSSGNNHHGKITGAKWVKVNRSAIIARRSALAFDGNAEVTAAIPTIDFAKPFTLEAYVTTTKSLPPDGKTSTTIVGIQSTRLVYVNDDRWSFTRSNGKGGEDNTATAAKTVNIHRRSHVAGVFTGQELRIYQDGMLLSTKPATALPSNSGKTPLKIGSMFDGIIDTVRVSTTARYDQNFVPAVQFATDADTLALYHFDEGEGDILKDSSGNNHHGKITGARWVKIEPVASEFGLHFEGMDLVRMDKGFDFKNDSYTVEAVVHLDRHQSFASIFGISGSENGALVLGGANGDRWQWNHHAVPSGHFSVTADQPALLGKRVHLAGVRDRNDFYLFIDGKLAGTRKANDIELVGLGKHLPQMGTRLTGTLYGIRVSSKPRYLADFVPPVRLESDADTAALCLFKEGAGDTLEDSSGNGHLGKIVGAKWVNAPIVSPEPLQAEWAAKLKLPVESENGLGMKLMLIPPGDGVEKPFYMGKYEVTQREWEKVMGYNPSEHRPVGAKGDKLKGLETANFPVDKVNWFDCVEFCNKLSETEGLKPYYELTATDREGRSIKQAEVKILGGNGYHIPTHAEWTWACTAGAKTKFHFGNDESMLKDYGWYLDNSDGRTHAVGEKKPNPFGLYDFHGNVGEWNELLSKSDGVPVRAALGGNWRSPAPNCAASHQYGSIPSSHHNSIGLRLARVPASEVTLPAASSSDARQQQAEWAAKLKLPVESTSPTGIAMVVIPPGEGVDKPFLMGKYEVTQGEFEKVMGYNFSDFGPKNPKVSDLDTSKFPVEKVNWFEGVEFCNKLSEKEGLKPYYELIVKERQGSSIEQAVVKILGGNGYHLPTDAQWTWACAAGTKTLFYFGNDESALLEHAWCGQNSAGMTHPVGKKKPNGFGLYDLAGNVNEWMEDLLPDSRRYPRGGSWFSNGRNLESQVKTTQPATYRMGTIGFRVARTPSEVDKISSIVNPAATDPQKLQAEWAAKLKLPVESTSPTGISMVVIPPGEGVAKPFLMGKYEVAQGEWEKVMGYNPSEFGPKNPKVTEIDASKFPVEQVTWFDGVEFCNKLSEKEGLKPYYELTVTKREGPSIEQAEVKILGGNGYHLPTDAEWTWACAAGAKTKYHFGDRDEDLSKYAWYGENTSAGRLHRVGEKKPNAFGLHDTHGNVREMNEDSLTNATTGAQERLNRGGAWNHPPVFSYVSNRRSAAPGARYSNVGLRLARVLQTEVSLPADAGSEAKRRQAEWAAQLKRPVESTSPTGISMVVIPPGEGVAKPFLMGKYEVAQAEWEKVMGYNPSEFGPKNAKLLGQDAENFPVEMVNWYDCVEFCNKLSEKDGLKPYYELTVTKREGPSIDQAEVKIRGGNGYHIPTDAEWTWACAAGAKTRYHFGVQDGELPEYAWFDQNSIARTHRVGVLKPNDFGLYDIHGNVREWNEEMLTKADGSAERAHRGGAWSHSSRHCPVNSRSLNNPRIRSNNIGLRIARLP